MSSTTRGDLEALAREPYPGVVGVLTKSPLVLRDVDVLRALPQAEVGLTVTTTNDRLSRFLEVRAPLASRRLRMLAELHAEGDPDLCLRRATPAPLPLRPRCAGRRRSPPVFAGIAKTGVDSVFVEHINLRPYLTQRLREVLDPEPANIQQVYRDASTSAHRDALAAAILELLRKHGLGLRPSKVLYHHEQGPGESVRFRAGGPLPDRAAIGSRSLGSMGGLATPGAIGRGTGSPRVPRGGARLRRHLTSSSRPRRVRPTPGRLAPPPAGGRTRQ